MGTYDELNAEHQRLEEQRQKELAEKARQQEIDATQRPEKAPLMGTYAALNETHRRIEAERQAGRTEETPQQPIEAPLRPENSAAQPAPKNNYFKSLDAEEARRVEWAEAFEKEDEKKQAALLAQAHEKGFDATADQNAGQRLALEQGANSSRESKEASYEVEPTLAESGRENVESSPRETTDKALEKSEKAQAIADWLNNRSLTQRTREKERGQEM